ncbi:MAG: sugar phosphate isomerase/epimerase [Bacteroidales bacterium]|nr:sugar phosphate isomerase/epimerase [Bacteroidales bacterium]
MESKKKNGILTTRRTFLKSLPVFSAGAFLPLALKDASAALVPGDKKIAIQLWSLRDILKDDLQGVLAQISRLGFTGIEPYGFDGKFYGVEAKEFRKICSDLKLEIYSTHTGITADNADFYSEKAVDVGMQYLVLPSFAGRPDKTAADFQNLAEEMNRIGETCKQYNLRFGYHNHDFEFRMIDDVLLYEILLKETDPDLVFFQPDTYFFAKAGYNLPDFIHRYPGRFLTWHIKDRNNDGDSCIIGNGRIDFKNILNSSAKAGLELMIYEQEHCSEGSPIHCAEQSLQYIHSHLL